jgi:hypothetical protein
MSHLVFVVLERGGTFDACVRGVIFMFADFLYLQDMEDHW